MTDQKMQEEVWDKHKTCGEISCNECNDRFEALLAACASKQMEIDNWKIVAEDWRVKAVDWSRKNAELERRLRLIALEEYENPPVEPSEVYSPHVKVIK